MNRSLLSDVRNSGGIAPPYVICDTYIRGFLLRRSKSASVSSQQEITWVPSSDMRQGSGCTFASSLVASAFCSGNSIGFISLSVIAGAVDCTTFNTAVYLFDVHLCNVGKVIPQHLSEIGGIPEYIAQFKRDCA